MNSERINSSLDEIRSLSMQLEDKLINDGSLEGGVVKKNVYICVGILNATNTNKC